MKSFISILLFFCTFISFGQFRGKNNSQLTLTGGIGYPYQSGTAAIPLRKSHWHLYGQINTDLGGIAINLSYSDNQGIGVLREFELHSKSYLRAGAGLNITLHRFPLLPNGATAIAQYYYLVNPYVSLGASFQQPLVQGKAWDSYYPLVQFNSSIHLRTRSTSNGLHRTQRMKQPLMLHIGTGIHYSTLGASLYFSKNSRYSFSIRSFATEPRFFGNHPKSKESFQWFGLSYLKTFGELGITGGVGTGLRFKKVKATISPVVMLGIRQKILPETSLIVEAWQPARGSLNGSTRPVFITGIAVLI